MNRNLIDPNGYHRSLLVGDHYNRAGADPVAIFTTAATVDPIDPSVVRSGGGAITWNWGDGNSDTGNSVSHNYGGAGSYDVTWDAWPGSITTLDLRQDYVTSINTSCEWTNLKYGYFQYNDLTSLDTFATWNQLIYLYCNYNSLTSLDTFDTWVDLTVLDCQHNSLTSLDTFDTWTNLTTFYFNHNSLTSIATFDTWTKIQNISCNLNSLTSFETHPEWTALKNFRVPSNSLTSIETHPEWINLLLFWAYNNAGIAAVYVHPEWVLCTDVRVNDCNLPDAEIDDILVNLDTAGAINGILNYSGNPGAPDGGRSGAAATAKANLVGKGWVITIA